MLPLSMIFLACGQKAVAWVFLAGQPGCVSGCVCQGTDPHGPVRDRVYLSVSMRVFPCVKVWVVCSSTG